jgi:two-component system OmpR family response regulator
MTRSEIIEHVWDVQFDSESNLVEVYVNKLRNKIDSGRAVPLLHTVRGIGYRIGLPE